MADLDENRPLTPGEREMLAIKTAQDARLRAMVERMQRSNPVEAVGMVEEICSFGGGAERSLSLELKPWRWAHGPLERGSLYIRKEAIHEHEHAETQERLPRFSLVRVRVRPDVDRRDDLWDCLLEDVLEVSPPDEELQVLVDKLKAREPTPELGRPAFDWKLLLFDLLARTVPRPEVPVVHLGQPLPPGDWVSPPAPTFFDGCDVLRLTADVGAITVGVLDGRVEGVYYDLTIYRGSGRHRARKLQTLLEQHGRRTGKLHRILDNQGGAMMYRDRLGEVRAIYAYNVDVLIIHSKRISIRRSSRSPLNGAPRTPA